MLKKVLIANRGEIAVRIIRECLDCSIEAVSVYSTADKQALHTIIATKAICIGGPRAGESYLNISNIIEAAKAEKCDAIHPGFGFLSENSQFARACEENGIKFIGPASDTIDRMGNKSAARRLMVKAGVPVVPGSDGAVKDAEEAVTIADKIGYPVLIKAKAGGGGRGIRLVSSPDAFENAFYSASSEAQSAFGDGACYMEKYLNPVKHIEMQILCDQYGNVVCLGERECSVQRKNQKLIEESPSPAITQDTRQRMIQVAAKAAKTVGYVGAGTIEFLYDQSGNFYFMEMNTRLQVEHPVTEMVTGIDLVQWQIRVAAGIELSFSQEDIQLKGHAIECRVNAEDPAHGFRPSCGQIQFLHIPGGPGVRFETAVYPGYFVPPFYDSMIGKLVVHGDTRDQAIRKMKTALGELVIEGISHNAELQMELMGDPRFVDGTYTTGLMAQREKERKA